MKRPLFGTEPVKSSLAQVETVCVSKFPASATRPYIWEGFNEAHGKVSLTQPNGEVWISGDFVVDDEDPDFAQVHLRVRPGPLTPEIEELLTFLNEPDTTERLGCDFSSLIEVPETDPAYGIIDEAAQFFLQEFTEHADGSKKGFPIIEHFGQNE